MIKTIRVLLIAALPFASHASGSEPDDLFSLGLEQLLEIEVVSRRFNESYRQVGRPLSVVTQQDLKENLATSVYDLSLIVPNLSYRRSFGRWQERPVIRGVAALSGAPSAGILIDGSPISNVSPTLPLHDIEQVEVLRGPEAALFGRATFSGALNFITRRPNSSTAVELSQSADTQNGYETTLWASSPLTDSISAAISTRNYKTGIDQRNDLGSGGGGYGDESSDSVSVSTAISVSQEMSLYYRFSNQFDEDGQIPTYLQDSDANNCFLDSGPQYFCGTVKTPYRVGFNNEYDNWQFTLNNKIERHFLELAYQKENHDIKIIYQKNESDFFASYDGDFYELNSTYFRNDLNSDNSNLDFLSNFYFENSRLLLGVSRIKLHDINVVTRAFNISGALTVRDPNITEKRVKNTAFFSSFDYSFNETTRLNLDLRYGIDKIQEMVPEISDESNKWSTFSPRLNLSHNLSERTLLYYSIAKGNQPGGFNSGLTQNSYADGERERALQFLHFNQESLLSEDIGIKTEAIKETVFLSASLFHYQWKDQQLTQSFSYLNEDNEEVRDSTTINGGRAENMGIEFEIDAYITSRLHTEFNLGYTRAKFIEAETSAQEDLTGSANISGKALPNVPRWTSYLGLHFHTNLPNSYTLFTHGGIYYESERYVAEHNFATIGQLFKTNISLGVSKNDWKISAWAKNLNNDQSPESVARFGDAATFFSRRAFGITLPERRSIGLSLEVKL